MNATIWVIQALLAAAFVMPGYGKLFSSREQHLADGHIKPGASLAPIRALGVLEWLGCIGLVLPWWTGILPVLTPGSAIYFCILMLAGMVVHIRKKEYKMLPLLSAIFLLAALVGYFRLTQLMAT